MQRTILAVLSLWFCGLVPAVVAAEASPTKAATIKYNRDVRPILVDNCFSCHGADSASRKGDLRLDKREAAITAQAIIPGKINESAAWERITSDDKELVMPPPSSHKVLTAEQKSILKRWIESGAEYEANWSFIAPTRPTLPTVKDQSWIKNPIDQFILAELEERNLTPASEADRRALARRLALDTTGLPPDPADVEAFVNDTSPNAYEKLVDKYMASEQWGEHRARYWLDYARYGDTHGIHFDNYREMWSYRDSLIKSFNDNKRFDQFTIESLAGDLLPNRTIEQQIASGFNRCNITTNEGGIIDEEYLVLYARDRVETTSQVWLGLTLGCAVCHSHKFDPIEQREFYEMAAFFNNTSQGAKDGNIPNTPPVIQVPQLQDRERFQKIAGELVTAREQLEAAKKAAEPRFKTWLTTAQPDELGTPVSQDKLHFAAEMSEGKGNKLKYRAAGKEAESTWEKGYKWVAGKVSDKALQIDNGDGVSLPDVGNFAADQPFSYGAWIMLPKKNTNGAVFGRMNEAKAFQGWDLWLQDDRVATHIIHAWPDNAIKLVAKQVLKPKQWYHVFVTYDGSQKKSGVKLYIDGKLQEYDVEADGLNGSIQTDVPFKIGQRHSTSRTVGVSIQDLQLHDRTLNAAEIATLGKNNRLVNILAKPADKRDPKEVNELRDYWLSKFDTDYQAKQTAVDKLTQEEVAIKSRGTIAHVMQEKDGQAKAHVLFRGEYDQRRDEVTPMTPKALPPMADDLPKNRLGLAKWLLQPNHPLTTRVTVNRMWQELFGQGLVRTSGDFGVSGELPSHPELLDWLAIEFRDTMQWDMKRFYKLVLMSATYRQAANTTPEKQQLDPQNRWLSRGPRFRMDAEMLRDYALAASGIMVKKIGGPSVKPYQPPGVWEAVAMPNSNTSIYKQDSGESLYRRSMYTFMKRAAPPASMEVFNLTNRELCSVRRERTNTPLQALVTLNDPQFFESARHLAQIALQEGPQDDILRIDFIARRLLARPFKLTEMNIVQQSLKDLRAAYAGKVDEARQVITVGDSKPSDKLPPEEFAAWTLLVNQLMNLDEVLCK